MSRIVAALVALAVALLLATAAVTGIAWAVGYSHHDITETYVEMLSIAATVGSFVTFGLYWHYRR